MNLKSVGCPKHLFVTKNKNVKEPNVSTLHPQFYGSQIKYFIVINTATRK